MFESISATRGEKLIKRNGSYLLLLLILSINFAGFIDSYVEDKNRINSSGKPIVINTPLYTNPINIISDNNFTDYGFSGNGTEELPYIIESFDIVTTEDFGINIEGTSKHFIVQNGYVEAYRSGIRISEVEQNTSTVKNCWSFRNTDMYYGEGISVRYSDGCQIVNNTCSGNNMGIEVYRSDNVIIEDNNCYGNIRDGIKASTCQFIQISENKLTTNDDEGLYLYFVNNSSIEGNNVTSNRWGIYADHLAFCNITFNQFIENERYGIEFDRCDYNNVHHNKFISNYLDGKSQAFDDNTDNNNLWYDELAEAGNYWNEFRNTGFSYKYEIEGWANAVDKYPLDENLEPIEQIYSNLVLGIVLFTYLGLLSIFSFYRLRKEEIQIRIQKYRNRKKMRKSKTIEKDYDKLLEKEYDKGREKLYKEGELR
jgi:parallel beta-helix repeat protein